MREIIPAHLPCTYPQPVVTGNVGIGIGTAAMPGKEHGLRRGCRKQ